MQKINSVVVSTACSMKYAFSILFILFFLYSCTKKSEQPLFQLEEKSGINFNNKIIDGPLENSFLFRNFYNGGGVAIGDINNDGFADVMFTSNMGDNKLYLNKGSMKFEDISLSSGLKQDSMWSAGVTFVDINNDGWLDIYVCNSGHMTNGNRKNKLYINNHAGPAIGGMPGKVTFTESAKQYGLDIAAYCTQTSFFDYDNDGDLDCFMINNSPMPVNTLNNSNRRDLIDSAWSVPAFLKGGGDHLYRNDDGKFKEVTQQAGIHGSLISFGLGASIGDINGDGYPDIYVSNDSYERDYIYINQKNGTFKDDTENCVQHTSFSSMGADMADINNDGYPEIFTTDMLPEDDYRLKTLGSFDNPDLNNSKIKSGFYNQYMKNCLQLNNKNGTFSDIANYSGVSATDWSWGAVFFDADNDGYNDLYVCNGVNRDVTNLDFMDFFANDLMQKMILTGKKEGVDEVLKNIPENAKKNKMYRNKGNLKFEDAGDKWGFTQPSFSNGTAYGDLDNDGDLDLIVNNINGPAFVYKNNSREINKNHFVGIKLIGNAKNSFAVGSKINVYAGNEILTKDIIPSRGFQSSVDYKQIIGLGTRKAIDSMVIIWPDRNVSVFYKPAVDSVFVLQQPSTKTNNTYTFSTTTAPTLFTLQQSNFDKHVEDDNVDFYYERNIPEMLSREGPKTAIGDVNGDGLDDIYIGGTQLHPGQMYFQTGNGSFVKHEEVGFKQYLDFEDNAVLFFDADADGDLDLFIGSGGNKNAPGSRELQNRLFKNDGKGNFLLDVAAFQSNDMNIGTIAAYDFNNDGYTDLFVGGRNVPREYGTAPQSYLYVNDGKGHFVDMAATKNADIAHLGMITGAVWADVAGDAKKELIVTGEWMSPHIYSFNGDHFIEMKNSLNTLNGLWQTVAAADLNGDGKQDLIFGNVGENFYLHPDAFNPAKLWINDFNQNATIYKILTYTIDGTDKPVFLKKELTDQFPGLKKQNLKHADYATKTIQQLFKKELIDKAAVKTFNYCSSIIAINDGKGNFNIQKLPVRLQLSSVNALVVSDVNNDGKPDVIAGGNNFNLPPQFGRLDASFGDVLINKGNSVFEWMSPALSGIKLSGQIKDIKQLQGKDGRYFIVTQNDKAPLLYKQTK